MATYYVSSSERDNYEDETRRFKYLRRSTAGKPVAKDLYDRLARTGNFVRLVKWENHEWREMDRANG